jgi:hypothetical protein
MPIGRYTLEPTRIQRDLTGSKEVIFKYAIPVILEKRPPQDGLQPLFDATSLANVVCYRFLLMTAYITAYAAAGNLWPPVVGPSEIRT